MGDLKITATKQLLVDDVYNRLVGEIYDSVTRANAFEPFLKLLCEVTASSSANMSTVDTTEGCFVGGWIYGFRREDIELYIEENLISQDPIAQTIMTSAPGRFYTFRETMDWEEFKKREIYRRWVEPQGIIDSAGSMIASERNTLTTLFVQRKCEHGEFTEEHLALLNSLVPHLQRAMSLYHRLLEKDIGNQPLTDAIDALYTPTIILDSRGLVSYANKVAREYIDGRRWLSIKDGVLSSTNTALRNKFISYLMNNNSYNFAGQIEGHGIIHAEVDGERIAFYLQPVNSSTDKDGHGGALLFIHRQGQRLDESKVPAVKELFHISLAEAQIALLLAHGMSVDAIASYTGRKANTVRMQLKSVFAKTGVNTQSQLVSLLLTSPVFLT